MSRKIIIVYYAATALFLLLDYGFGINVRVVFLDGAPGLRLVFYKDETVAVVHWCFWIISAVALIWNVLGVINYVGQSTSVPSRSR